MAEHQLHDNEETVDEEPAKTGKSTGSKKSEEATGAESQDRIQSTSQESTKKKRGKSQDSDADSDEDELDEEEYGVSMDKVEAVLNQSIDKKHMTPQMQRIVQRQEENTRRVEDTIKNTKSNPRWFVPLFVILMLLGLIWIVVYYIASMRGNVYPIPQIGNWNLAVGFGIMLVGFLMTMWWR